MSVSNSNYTPPGVTVTGITTQQITPNVISGSNLCLVGVPGNSASGLSPITVTDTILFGVNSSPMVLPTIESINDDAVLVEVLSMTDAINPSYGTPPGTGYIQHTGSVPGDYSVQSGEGPPDGGVNSITPSASTGTLTPIQGGAFNPSNDGTTWVPKLVNVTYTYTPTDYWNPIRMYDIGAVQSRFGNAWATDTLSNGLTVYTGVNSPLSLAAAFAFQNGAQSVILQPLFERATPGDPTSAQQPATATAIGNPQTWSDTLYTLRSITNLDVIIPVVGFDNASVTTNAQILEIFESIQAHIAYQNSQNDFMVTVLAEDGTYNPAQLRTLSPPNSLLWTHASALRSNYGGALSKQCILLNTSSFNINVPGAQGGTITVGGQYAAAAIGGALVSRATSSALTRQYISGFSSIVDNRSPSDKNNDAANGLLVLENINNGIRCRQGITVDLADGSSGQEISVVRSQFVMIESIQQTLDNQIIGQIIANANSPMIVETTINSILQILQGSKIIVGFTAPNATLTSLNPTTISVSFSYQPAFPLNYINITFGLNLTTGTVTTSIS
jgi:hypothetical protein